VVALLAALAGIAILSRTQDRPPAAKPLGGAALANAPVVVAPPRS